MLAVAVPILVAAITKMSGAFGYPGVETFPFPLRIEFPRSRIESKENVDELYEEDEPFSV